VLRPGGFVVDFQPAAIYLPRLAIVRDGVRREFGTLTRTPDADVVAAHRARRRAIGEGWFTRVVSTHGAYRTRYPSLADLRWLLRENANWHLEARTQQRLEAAWARRPEDASLEVRRAFSLAVLRKRAQRPGPAQREDAGGGRPRPETRPRRSSPREANAG
jgi:hypothetical protein